MDHWQTAVGICVGVGLAASCGFRVFVPLLMTSIAAKAELLTVADSFAWVGSWPAVIALSLATVLEIGGYYVPWLDNALDSIATPSSIVAGTMVAGACVVEMDPFLKWSLAVIAGGGSAAVIKAGTASIRAASSATTLGAGNFLVSTIELIVSFLMSLLALIVPVVAFIIAIVLVAVLLRFAIRFFRSRKKAPEPAAKDAA